MGRNLTLVVLLVVGSALSAAQDFRKVVQIVDEMETSLRKTIALEQDQRKADVAAVRREIDLMKQNHQVSAVRDTGEASTVTDKQWEQIDRRIAALERRLDKTNSEVVELTRAVSLLVTELKKSFK
jgi:hypothetical protein